MPRLGNMQARLGCQEGVTATWESRLKKGREMGNGKRKIGNGKQVIETSGDGAGGHAKVVGP